MGPERTPDGPKRWRLVLATVAFAVWAPASFAGLPFAALMLAARPARWAPALLVGLPSLALVFAPAGDVLGALAQAYILLATAAFITFTLMGKGRFLPQALRASAIAFAGVLVLARTVLGRDAAGMLTWAATRQASAALEMFVQVRPELYVVAEPVIRFVSSTAPATLFLQALAGLALAWQWHQQLAPRPLGAPFAPFREFQFADSWVWGVVGAIVVWITPLLVGLKAAALNLLVVLGALYLLRGAAVVVAFAGVAGISSATLVASLVASAVLALPLLFLIPGLATLGMTDTWMEFRRRLAGRPTAGKG